MHIRPHQFLSALAAVLLSAGMPASAQQFEIPQPSPGLMPNASAGAPLYAERCAGCHGSDLKGTHQGPPMLHKVYEPSHHGDRAFQAAVRYGVRAHHWKFGDMAPVQGVMADDVAHITAFIRYEQRKVGIH